MMGKKAWQPKHLHKHHRKPRSIGGDNRKENISLVIPDQHSAWHYLFKNYDAPTIAAIINTTWLDPNYEFVCVKKEK